MDNVFESNVLESSVSEGVGPFSLTAMPGFARFGEVLSVGKPCHYMIKAVDNVGRPTDAYEFGVGTYTGMNQLTRTTVVGSSNLNAPVNFLPGNKLVSFTALAPTTDKLRFDWQEALGMNLAGAVQFFAMSSAPTGWMKANGAAVSRATYARLFGRVGTTFGGGDGSTTFNLPDLRGEFIRGWDDGRTVDSGRTFASVQTSQNLSHAHGVYDPAHAHGVYDPTHAHGVADPGHAHSAWTDAQGWHGHGISQGGPNNNGYGMVQGGGYVSDAWTRQATSSTDGAGTHSHNVGVGGAGTGIGIYGAGTGISIYGAGTGVSIYADGGGEARPRNMSLLACIKF